MIVSLFAALFVILEFVSNMVPILEMPNGGSVSLSVIVLILSSYLLGVKKTIAVSGIGLLVMFMMKPPYILNVTQFAFDYIFAYTIYSFSSLLKTTKIKDFEIAWGAIIANVLRLMFHNIAGWTFFGSNFPGNVFWGVMLYNMSYMVPTFVLSVVSVGFILPKLEKIVTR